MPTKYQVIDKTFIDHDTKSSKKMIWYDMMHEYLIDDEMKKDDK